MSALLNIAAPNCLFILLEISSELAARTEEIRIRIQNIIMVYITNNVKKNVIAVLEQNIIPEIQPKIYAKSGIDISVLEFDHILILL